MIKPFQTDASVAREQDDALFKDLDQCADESKDPAPGVLGELLNAIDPQDLRIDKLLESALATLQEVKDAKQMVDKCCDRFVKTPTGETTPKCGSGWLRASVEWRYTHGHYRHNPALVQLRIRYATGRSMN